MGWTKDQELAITKSGTNIIVSAGAGSGKTAVLTERTIRKILNGSSINRLLILTFTKLAAHEMKERIRTSLKKANLCEQLDYIDSSYITTFDSFALSIVKKYHTLINLPSNISIMDASIELIKSKEILDNIFENSYDNTKFQKLIGDFCSKDDNVIKEVFMKLSPKIDLKLDKKSYLDNYIETHYNESYINSKIDEYINLVINTKELIKEPYYTLCSLVDNKFLTTYNLEPLLNSNSYLDIKNNINLIGIPRKNNNCSDDFKIYKDKINNIVKKLKELTRFENIESIYDSIYKTKDYVEVLIDLKNKFDETFLEYKKEKNIYTFTDIAKLAIDIVKNNPSIKNELTNSFDEIMVDEYQDTSDIQEEFLNLISNNNLYMVGDIKQSIYRFRNANPKIFKDKYDMYSKEINGIKIDLLKNFRSRKEVLDNINLIFNFIMDNELGDANYIESHQMNFGNTSYIEENYTDQNYNMDIFTYDKDNIEDYKEEEVEAFIVAHDILDKVSNKFLVVDSNTKKLRPVKFSDFSIIMDRGSSFDLYKKIFEYMNIPLLEINNKKLSEGYDLIIFKNIIKLIIKINLKEFDLEFKYLFVSVVRSYLVNMSDEEIFDIVSSNSFYNTELFKMLNINIYELSNIDLINLIIDKFDYYSKLITTNNIKETEIKIEYLQNLALNLSNLGYTIIEFSNYLDDMVLSEKIEYSLNIDDSNSVKILNIHKSKGLEYSICYFTGLYKKTNEDDIKSKFLIDSSYNIITPYMDNEIKQNIYKDLLISIENKETISEKIRLFYVALTRTKEKFIVVTPFCEIESFNKLVPYSIRISYKRISEMLSSIKDVLTPYIKEISLSDINISHDYNNKINVNLSNIESNIKIDKRFNNIDYEVLNSSRFSKSSNKLINKNEYDNMKKGIDLHYIFETEDFKNTNNKYVLKFIEKIDLDYINIYKEYEFIYQDNLEEKHGIIDLMLEYENHIDIVDYKMKNIVDNAYLNQLNGYKKYIESIINKKVNIYLYSIIDNNLQKLNDL